VDFDHQCDPESITMRISYCARRLQNSLDLAQASTDSCARLAHEGFARLYRAKLVELCHTADNDDGAVSLECPKAAG
jgi:hypothetical protein